MLFAWILTDVTVALWFQFLKHQRVVIVRAMVGHMTEFFQIFGNPQNSYFAAQTSLGVIQAD